jgi:hypothetical protein
VMLQQTIIDGEHSTAVRNRCEGNQALLGAGRRMSGSVVLSQWRPPTVISQYRRHPGIAQGTISRRADPSRASGTSAAFSWPSTQTHRRITPPSIRPTSEGGMKVQFPDPRWLPDSPRPKGYRGSQGSLPSLAVPWIWEDRSGHGSGSTTPPWSRSRRTTRRAGSRARGRTWRSGRGPRGREQGVNAAKDGLAAEIERLIDYVVKERKRRRR